MNHRTAFLFLCAALSLSTGGCDLTRSIVQSLPSSQPTPVDTPDTTESPTPIETDASQPAGRPAILSGLPAGSKINVRSQPNIQAAVYHYGTVGDRVHVGQQQQDDDGKTWYYVTFDDADARGWVYGNLIRFSDTSANNPPPNTSTPINSDTALRRCRSQAEAEFPNARVQVSQAALNSDGSYIIKWSTDSGAQGTCTVDRNGWVVSFVNTYEDDNPPDYSIPPAALRGCENRVASQLGLSPYDIEVRESSAYADGTFGVDWWTRNGRSGFCRVNRNGNVLAFVTNDNPSPIQVALNRCRDRARQAYPGTRIEVYLDPRDRSRNYKVIWSASSGQDGYCRVDANGRLYEFVDNSDNGGDRTVRCNGNVFGDLAFTAFARDRQFQRAEFSSARSGNRFTAYLNPAGENEQGQPIYRGRSASPPPAEITVIDRSGGEPAPGTEISLAYNGEWARGRCQ